MKGNQRIWNQVKKVLNPFLKIVLVILKEKKIKNNNFKQQSFKLNKNIH